MTTLVLIYHGITDTGGGTANMHALPKRNFIEQVGHIKRKNYSVLPWRKLCGPSPTDHPLNISITFDDGCASDIESARMLREQGYDALFFVATEFVDKPGYMTRADIIALRDMGMGIGSHAHLHAMMGSLSEPEIESQFRDSKAILEEILQEPVEHFSFPGGSYNQRMIEIGRQAGFRYFYTSDWGNNGPTQYQAGIFRRTSVLNHMSIAQFDDLISSRHNVSRQILFQAKEFAKRIAGEGLYVKLRQVLLGILRAGKSN